MVVASLLVIPALVLEDSAIGAPWAEIAIALNWIIWCAFAIELATMLAVVPDRFQWLRQHPIEVVIVFLTPPFMPAAIQSLRAFRLLRVLRLVRIFDLRRLLSLEGVRYAAFVAGLLILIGGAMFSVIEVGPRGEALTTWDGIWWAVTTVTTVGYGDLSPSTDAGRAIAALIMSVGIGFVALLTAFVAERFIRGDVRAESEEIEDRVVAELREIQRRLDRIEAWQEAESSMLDKQSSGGRAMPEEGLEPPTRGL